MANKYIRHGATYNGDGLTSDLASGSAVTFTVASPGKVNWTGHGLAANALVYFGVTTGGALPTGITAGNTYYVRNPGSNDFEISDTSGGASKALSGTPSGTATATTTGAWNHIDIFEGTAVNSIAGVGTEGGGAVATNDVVYIRSKDASGANIARTLASATVNLGSSSATLTAPITWILDNGPIWGVDGTITWTTTNSNYYLVVRDYNRVIAQTQDALAFVYNVADPIDKTVMAWGLASYIKNWLVDTTAKTGTFAAYLNPGVGSVGENIHVKYGKMSKHSVFYPAATNSLSRSATLINPWIELLYTADLTANTGCMFGINNSSGAGVGLRVFGGKVTGTPASSGYPALTAALTGTYIGTLEVFGFSYPKEMPTTPIPGAGVFLPVTVVGADSGYGSFRGVREGQVDSRNLTYNYPVLNATIPDSASTGWSWRMYPYAANEGPLQLPMAKVYQESAAAKKVTVEMAVATGFATADIDRYNIWMTVSYVKTDGTLVTESTRTIVAGTALTSSSAMWNATNADPSWGAVSTDRYKLELTTANSIKQNTMVLVTLFWGLKSGSATDVVFVCPDPQLSTP
jgi:hypothetical protein